MKYPRYPAYKDSRIEWLGEIPAHWSLSVLGYEASVKARLGWRGLKAEEYVDDGYIFLATPNIKATEIDFVNVNYITQERYDESPEIMLETGDVLVTKDGSTVGTTNVVRHLPAPSTVNSSIAVIRPKQGVEGFYLCYFFQSSPTQNVIQRMKGGMGVPHLFQADLRKFRVLVPPQVEQTAIAGFLDRETAKIDALIAKQERLIAQLQEKRQALISHVVTKGLDPAAPMKDSGIEWLGEAPVHWEIRKFASRLNRIEAGWTPYSEQRQADDNEWAVVKVGCIRNGEFFPEENKVLGPGVTPISNLEIRPGDLIMSRANTTELVGSIGLVRQTRPRLTLCDKTYRLILNECLLSNFVNYLLQARVARHQIEVAANGASASMRNISQESIRSLVLPFPPITEQKQIVSYLDAALDRINRICRAAEQVVLLLQERRAALISAAVTGKIDVRNLVN